MFIELFLGNNNLKRGVKLRVLFQSWINSEDHFIFKLLLYLTNSRLRNLFNLNKIVKVGKLYELKSVTILNSTYKDLNRTRFSYKNELVNTATNNNQDFYKYSNII